MDLKICGVRTPEMALLALDAGATHIGYVFFEPSPRDISPDKAAQMAEAIAVASPQGLGSGTARFVGLFVDARDSAIEAAVKAAGLDVLQFHGSESPERVKEARERFGLPVWKAIGVGQASDIEKASIFEGAAERLLFDARPPKSASRPGGNARAFDWTLLSSVQTEMPWMLSGGLTPNNVADAISVVRDLPGFAGLDVSSGVERAPGEKDEALVRAFIAAARGAQT